MTERDIFNHLFAIAPQSKDTDGVVTCCLVRDGVIVLDAVSAGIEHAEYELFKKAETEKFTILPEDILYVTVQPCDSRTPGSGGEALGDCTTNSIKAGIKNIIYGVSYPRSRHSLERCAEAGVSIRQVGDINIIKECADLFNSTNEDTTKHIPAQ
jgi:pyrimidine deaminase RibD-like protein